jgi:hypothetical protein
MSDIIEVQFIKSFNKDLTELKESQLEKLKQDVPENFAEYKYCVGYVRAVEDIEEKFARLLQSYFPS